MTRGSPVLYGLQPVPLAILGEGKRGMGEKVFSSFPSVPLMVGERVYTYKYINILLLLLYIMPIPLLPPRF